ATLSYLFAPPPPPAPSTLSLHDALPICHPQAFPRWTRAYAPRIAPRVIRNAARVIAVSAFTRRELVELLGVDERKIRVVPNAVRSEEHTSELQSRGHLVCRLLLEKKKNE